MMRNVFSWAMLMAVVLTAGLTSCSSDDDDESGVSVSESQIVGLWEADVANSYIVFNGQRFNLDEEDFDGVNDRVRFSADHAFASYEWRNSQWVEDTYNRGTWSLSGSTLTLTFSYDEDVKSAVVTQISANRLVLRTSDEEYDEDSDRTIRFDVYEAYKRVAE